MIDRASTRGSSQQVDVGRCQLRQRIRVRAQDGARVISVEPHAGAHHLVHWCHVIVRRTVRAEQGRDLASACACRYGDERASHQARRTAVEPAREEQVDQVARKRVGDANEQRVRRVSIDGRKRPRRNIGAPRCRVTEGDVVELAEIDWREVTTASRIAPLPPRDSGLQGVLHVRSRVELGDRVRPGRLPLKQTHGVWLQRPLVSAAPPEQHHDRDVVRSHGQPRDRRGQAPRRVVARDGRIHVRTTIDQQRRAFEQSRRVTAAQPVQRRCAHVREQWPSVVRRAHQRRIVIEMASKGVDMTKGGGRVRAGLGEQTEAVRQRHAGREIARAHDGQQRRRGRLGADEYSPVREAAFTGEALLHVSERG